MARPIADRRCRWGGGGPVFVGTSWQAFRHASYALSFPTSSADPRRRSQKARSDLMPSGVRCGARPRLATTVDSRLRGNDGKGAGVWRVQCSDPYRRRIHGLSPLASARALATPIAGVHAVIPAQAGIHELSPLASARALATPIAGVRAVIPAQAGIHELSPLASARALATPIAGVHAVIPAQAGIHELSPLASARVPDTPIAGVPAVLPAG